MIKETFTDKLIKRFYGITGPLDEQKRQQVDRMGNIAFVVLFFTLLCGNCIAFLIGFKYPELVARIYPILLLIIILLVSSILTYKLKIGAVNAFDEEELTEKEQKQLKHAGLKSGLFFGVFMCLCQFRSSTSSLQTVSNCRPLPGSPGSRRRCTSA